MKIKGFPNVRPLGVLANGDDEWYYYYEITDGLLELEITHDPMADVYTKTVTGLITDPDDIEDHLGH